MIRAIKGIASPARLVGITLAVPPLVMMADNLRDLCVAVNPRQDVLTDLRVGLHQASLRES